MEVSGWRTLSRTSIVILYQRQYYQASMKTGRRLSIIALILIAICILGFSLSPRPIPDIMDWTFSDKIEHFAAFAALGFLAAVAVGRRSPVAIIIVIALCSLYGGVIELVQPAVGRTKDLRDFLVDIAGTAVGVFAALLLKARSHSRASK